MAAKHNYRVLREMDGDKPYAAGDPRELDPNDAAHLVRLGVLEDLGPVEEKAEPDPANKADAAPANKAAAARRAAKTPKE
ncbi:hypothetical protein SAMN06295912_108124 [Sphingomonas laterariae]|uniref:Uncharacterized protein n=1 Tax=Edaphosphingomonas laterariae TaxID=861865 RepID=A0A239F8H1_9SPHN|nr:hypothetical protein [Sphingomonas laterariae]SNS53340.1 hypothetical protein SAMN06295912_108124 [Sphingomonas laterariae]